MRIARTFAASFVITVGSGCTPATTSPPNDPATGPQTGLQRQADGTCLKTYEVNCPPEATCNPPPPEVVDCDSGEPIPPRERDLPPIDAAGAGADAATGEGARPPRPDPGALPPPSGKPGTEVVRRAEGTCWEITHVDCPPNAKCNPPPPLQVECP